MVGFVVVSSTCYTQQQKHMLHNTTTQVVVQIATCVKKIEVGSDLILILGGGLSVIKNPHDSSLHQQNGRLSDQKI